MHLKVAIFVLSFLTTSGNDTNALMLSACVYLFYTGFVSVPV